MSTLLSHDDRANLDCAALGGRDLGGQLTRFVDRAAFQDEEAAERFLDLGVRPVGDEPVAVADTDCRRVIGLLELGAADDLVLRREVHVTLKDRLALVLAQLLPAVLISVNQCDVLHSSSFLLGEPKPDHEQLVREPRVELRRLSLHHIPLRPSQLHGSSFPSLSQARRTETSYIDNMRWRSVSAPALSSGSFRFPHFGDWTQEGQPCSQGQPSSIRAVSAAQPSNESKPRSVIPTPPAWPS